MSQITSFCPTLAGTIPNEHQYLVAKLCAMLKMDAFEENVGQCEMEDFDKLKAAELKAFIIALSFNIH
jgi:hypothetical protein